MCDCKRSELDKEINWQGMCEEFHQKRGDWYLMQYYKSRRIELELLRMKQKNK